MHVHVANAGCLGKTPELAQLKMHFEDHDLVTPLELILLDKCWMS